MAAKFQNALDYAYDDAIKDRPDLTHILNFSLEQGIVGPQFRLTTSASTALQLTVILRENKKS